MFNESWPWKRELAECAARLRNASEPDQWGHLDTDGPEDAETEAIFEVERDVMVGAFALRRLLEMPYKVTQQIRKYTVEVTTYPLRSDRSTPDFIDALDAFEWYDLTKPEASRITTTQMCNLFIHSHVLHFAWDLIGVDHEEANNLAEADPRLEGPVTLGGFYVATDIGSRSHLTRVDLEVVANSFDAMAQDGRRLSVLETGCQGTSSPDDSL